MRVVAEDVAILKSTGLAFVGIANEVFLARKLTRHEAPLQAGRKTCTTSTTQGRLFDFGDNLILGDFFRQNFSERLVTAAGLIRANAPIVRIIDLKIGEDGGVDVRSKIHTDPPKPFSVRRRAHRIARE